ncbi:MAG: hypothetical protein PHI97_12270, partial [Desulfobulbus sp.]|nr:hypothetical protein [Desulfobulbus sp.]
MNSLLHHIQQKNNGSFDTLVVVGAGSGANLATLRAFSAKRLILIEAHPRLAEELARQVRTEQGEEARHLAITAHEAEQAALQVCTNAQYSSLEEPQELTRIASNLRITGQVQVPAMHVRTLLEGLNLETGKTNLLILDTPGQNAQLLQAVPPELLQRFAWIIVQGGAVSHLYTNDLSVEDTGPLLEKLGFDNVGLDSEVLYPFAALALRRNSAAVRVLQLESALAALQEQMLKEKIRVDEQRTLIITLTKERDNLTGQKAELEKAKLTQVKLANERLAAIDAISKERDNLLAQNTELEKAKLAQAKLANERLAAIDAISKERDNLLAQNTELEKAKLAQAKLENERLAAIDAISKERDNLLAQNTELEKAKLAQAKLANERLAAIDA